jgi:general secretion pathway protein C
MRSGNLSRQARVRPYFEKGKRAGLIVTGIRSGSVFQKIGLRNSDILLNVNGQPVVSSGDYRKFLSAVESSADLKLQVRRRGKVEEIEYSF